MFTNVFINVMFLVLIYFYFNSFYFCGGNCCPGCRQERRHGPATTSGWRSNQI